MSAPDNQNPYRDAGLNVRLQNIEIALLGLADRVEALEARLGHGDRERETQNIMQRLDALETNFDRNERALRVLIDGMQEEPPRRRPLIVRMLAGFWRLITT